MSVIIGIGATAWVVAFLFVRIFQRSLDNMHDWADDVSFLGIFTAVFTAGGLRESNKASRRWRPRIRSLKNKIDSRTK